VLNARLIPYHSWASRGPSTMRVWLPVSREALHSLDARH
jgi:DUF1680 family protein